MISFIVGMTVGYAMCLVVPHAVRWWYVGRHICKAQPEESLVDMQRRINMIESRVLDALDDDRWD